MAEPSLIGAGLLPPDSDFETTDNTATQMLAKLLAAAR
jgi:hypothetical protein